MQSITPDTKENGGRKMTNVNALELMRTATLNKECSYREASDYYAGDIILRNPVMKYLDRLDATLNFNPTNRKSGYTSNTL